jgi:uncharacterized lipoprotein YajG
MCKSTHFSRGHVRRFLLIVTSLFLLAGCSGDPSGTAAFPDTGKKANMTKEIPKVPVKGMDRVGSEAAQ